jgi:hypothetical protein
MYTPWICGSRSQYSIEGGKSACTFIAVQMAYSLREGLTMETADDVDSVVESVRLALTWQLLYL